MLNVICFIFQFSKVKSMSRERYKDLKESINKEKALVKSYYLDWQHLKREVDSSVAFVKNIEKYIKGLIIVSILIVSFNYINDIWNANANTSKIAGSSIIEINVDNLEKKKKEEIDRINLVNEKIVDKHIKKVIILFNNEEVTENKSFKAIYNYFSIFRKENEILLIKEESENKENIIKIILVEG